MIGSAGPAGLNLRAPVTTSLPGGTDPPWGGAAWVDHLARWDGSEAFPHLGAGLDWGAGPVRPPQRLPPLPDASWVAFCRRRRRLRGYRGGDGRGGGSSLWPGRARPPARPPAGNSEEILSRASHPAAAAREPKVFFPSPPTAAEVAPWRPGAPRRRWCAGTRSALRPGGGSPCPPGDLAPSR